MKKKIGLIILMGIMVIASGCGITHETKVDSTNLDMTVQGISEVNR